MLGELSRKLDVASCVFVVVMVTAFSLHARPFGECSMHHFLPELFKKKLRSVCAYQFTQDQSAVAQRAEMIAAEHSLLSFLMFLLVTVNQQQS